MTPAAALDVVWIDCPEALEVLSASWQTLAERLGADPYLMPDWQKVWWRHFGAGRRLACLTAHLQGRLVAVLPFCLETHWAGPVPLRMARLAGTDPHCLVFRLPVEPAFAAPVLAAALRHLTGPAGRGAGCAAVSFTPVSDRAVHLPLLRSLAAPGTGLALHEEPAGAHVVFDLPPRFEDFLDRLSKKRRSQFRRDVTGLEEAFAMTSTHGTADARGFAAFVAFHNRQWQALGRGGHFVDWPGSAAFYSDLAEVSAARGWVWLHSLTGSDPSGAVLPLATQFVLVAGPTAHWRLPARSLEPTAERLSAGKVGLVQMIDHLIAQSVTLIEAGRGDYGYKLDYGGQSVPVHRLILSPEGSGARRKLRLLLALSDLLDLVYYRIWFLKLVPRLARLTRRKPRALWQSWIRTRF